MIRGVVFDLDHTLFDRYGTLQKVLPRANLTR
jgi:phosphoglycolate phosphatase-like HAD superfamily hydrolase